MNITRAVFTIAVAIAVLCAQPPTQAADRSATDTGPNAESSTDEPAEQAVPRIVLHDILTNRVCVYESKLYSAGAKVVILGAIHECMNANPMTFGSSDDKWDMRWVPAKNIGAANR
jgi:hypothetical protein